MEKSPMHKRLSEIGDQIVKNQPPYNLNPDNHDTVHIALGLLNAEAAEKLAHALEMLRGQISGLQYTISTSIEMQVEKMIASNEKLAKSNEYYAKWNKLLAVTLVLVTLLVGLLQAGVLIWTALHKP